MELEFQRYHVSRARQHENTWQVLDMDNAGYLMLTISGYGGEEIAAKAGVKNGNVVYTEDYDILVLDRAGFPVYLLVPVG